MLMARPCPCSPENATATARRSLRPPAGKELRRETAALGFLEREGFRPALNTRMHTF